MLKGEDVRLRGRSQRGQLDGEQLKTHRRLAQDRSLSQSSENSSSRFLSESQNEFQKKVVSTFEFSKDLLESFSHIVERIFAQVAKKSRNELC